MADMRFAIRKSGILISVALSDIGGEGVLYEIWISLVVDAAFRWSEGNM